MSGKRAAWRTAEREAILRRDWPAGIWRDVIHARMQALPGPEFPAHFLSVWAQQLNLPRPDGFRRAIMRVVQEAALRANKRRAAERSAAEANAPPPVLPEDDEDGEVAPLPPGMMRQTPGLRAALDLLAHGLPPDAIRDRVKLTATEFARVREIHAQQRAA